MKWSLKNKKKLVSLEEIKDIQPIVGANRIHLIKFGDCQCVARISDGWQIGQNVLVIRAGCIIPKHMLGEVGALRKTNKGMVKVISPRHVLSDCIIMHSHRLHGKIIVGEELSGKLGIKYRNPYKHSMTLIERFRNIW